MTRFANLGKLGLAAALAVAIGSSISLAQEPGDPLVRGFQTPPATAKPRVWWHWMNGNITKEGIDQDLDWMNRVGIGGFQNFDAALNTPKVVDKRLIYMTPEWKDAFLFATQKADKLGLEMAIAGSPGWSESGGPWVEPSHAMKKFVWTETSVTGGQPFHGVLQAPSTVVGPFQSLAQADPMGQMGGVALPAVKEFYADSAVIAYRKPVAELSVQELHPKITSSGGSLDVAHLSDHDLMSTARVPIAPVGEKAWIQFEFSQAQPIQGVTFALGGPRDPLAIFAGETGNGPVLEASDDGQTFRPVVTIPTAGAVEHTLSFAPVTARFFRLSFLTKAAPAAGLGDIDFSELGVANVAKPKDYQIAELELHAGARVNRFEEKAGFAALPDLYKYATPDVPKNFAIASSDVIDLTSKMHTDGTLDWTPPSGDWTVLRMGYSLTGITNHPATPEATGPEVDKLNRGYVKEYIEHYLDNYKNTVGDLMGKRGLQYVITDSWEAGTQNWTDDMIAEFTKRRGYDPRPWMPVLAGHVVDSAASSDRFLWDFRKTIADLVAENHYGQIAESVKARGMGVYGESHESGRATIGDGMEMKRYTNVPMAAMWTQRPGINEDIPHANADVRESASVAHIYGQNLVAAESMTAAASPWAWSPETLKPTADKELSMGLNRFVIHTSVHQPLMDKAPGLALGPFGQWFNRNETWAEQARPWVTYLARNSYLLQQGRFVADIAYFYGEDSNVTAIFEEKNPAVPEGYNFDYFNADALIHKLSFSNGQLTTPSGMVYRVLALDPYSHHMSLPVLRRIQELVRDGAVVIGDKPTDTPSLGDKTGEFQRIVSELWGTESGVHSYGKGKVYGGQKLEDALQSIHIARDFDYTKPKSDTSLLFVHRAITGGDLYFVDNRTMSATTFDASFRVTGKSPELWHADTGKIEPASYRIQNGRTTVPLTLNPYETVFVVFRKPTTVSSRTLAGVVSSPVATVDGSWDVSFQPGRGAPAQATFDALRSWSENSDAGIKYFSGHGTYTKMLDAPAAWFKPGADLWLDLGDVKNLAEVKLNGVSLGILWKAPFRVNVTKVLKPGVNKLEVAVTNLWVNRLIGDQQPGTAQKYTFTTHNPYKATSPLLSSGLIGPVQVVRSELQR
jgi:hypothetical protein